MLPKTLDRNYIEEVACEIRFKSYTHDAAILGVVLPIINKHHQPLDVQRFPILDVPESLRINNPELKYQPHYRLVHNNLSFNIGPRTLIISNTKEYIGGVKLINCFENIFRDLFEINFFESIESLGLRYVNIFDKSLNDIANISASIGKNKLTKGFTLSSKEIIDNSNININLADDTMVITSDNRQKTGSIIDLDFFTNLSIFHPDKNSSIIVYESLEKAHTSLKELFFNDILKSEYLQSLSPNYENNN